MDKWHYAFLSMFVAAAFGFIFANAWNNLSLTMLRTYERKDDSGQVIHPVKQSFYYALVISGLCALLLWFFYEKVGIRKK